MTFLSRRLVAAAIAVIALFALTAGAGAAAAPYRYMPAKDDRSIGKAEAPVTVIEYGSVACPHCATWDNTVFEAFKAKYVDTGKVRFVFREMLTGNPQLAAAGFITARCAAPEKYFPVVHAIFREQEAIYKGGQLRAPLLAIAKEHGGLTESQFDACLSDQTNFDAVSARSDANAVLDNVDGTPAFIVNGVRLTEAPTLEGLDKAISEALAAAKTPASAAKKVAAPAKK